MEYKYARRMSYVTASEIRELLKLTEQPEVISFAGGLPAPELFPIEESKLPTIMCWTTTENTLCSMRPQKDISPSGSGSPHV